MRSSTLALVPGLTACLALAACGGSTPAPGSTTRMTVTTTATAPATSTGTSTGTSTQAAGATTEPGTAATTATHAAGGRCSALLGSLTREQKVGQLLMVGLDAGWDTTHDDATIRAHHVGNAIYLGGWYGRDHVAATSAHLQSLADDETTGGVQMLLAADQEGGVVHQLRGDGFTQPPSALKQTAMGAAAITDLARDIGGQLKSAGVNVDLAPVADTVPASLGTRNIPIGKWGRQYGSDPSVNARAVTAFVTGLSDAGVGSSVKHFPGLGRVLNNTDEAATGITDETTTADDAYLQPFVAGMKAGAGSVMVSSARYPKIDPSGTQAVFSKPIITDLLRGRLGWQGVVATDDMGNAKAVSATPPGERATRFVDAGGDLVLTGVPEDIAPMSTALLARAEADPAFAAKVDASADRILTWKAGLGLAKCG